MFKRLTEGLKRTKTNFTAKITNLFVGKKVIDAELLSDLETQLLLADIGVGVTEEIIAELKKCAKDSGIASTEEVLPTLKKQLLHILKPHALPLEIPKNTTPYVILVAGVNGSGKTTTIGKLARLLKKAGKEVLLAAGDTFRAAAIEQLQIWGERNNISVIAQHAGADSAAVAFDALNAAKARGVDVLIIDTAGRLHTQSNLMAELKKVVKVLKKVDPEVPHEVLLVLDAGVGQNALNQAREFDAAIGVTGLVLTKLDGTAKGGIIFAIAKALQKPIRFIGVGEKIDDLQPFNAEEFVEALFE
ncbi:MAG: signal recognition particle-docking protein FtsY [Gammaproteobacteria bacterium]|jgi:fused signal recognition particle receptor